MSAPVDVAATATIAAGTYIDALPVAALFVDESYQRPADLARARQYAAHWDRRLAGVIEVSDRGEDVHPRYAVIDGQHRWQGALLRDPAAMLVASIHEGLSVADEARLFDRINRERRRPSTWDHWRARKASGDPTVIAIEAVVRDVGLRIDPAPKAGNVRCTATLEKLAALGGPVLVGKTLKMITDVWSRDVDSFDAPMVHAIGLILHHLRDRIDQHRLIDTLFGVTPLALKNHVAALGQTLTVTGTTGVRTAQAIMFIYNKNRRVPGKAILVSARSFGGGSRNARSRSVPAKTA